MKSKKVIQNNLTNEAREIFTSYLEKNKQRKTPERFAIFEEIYTNSGHFDAEYLYIKMQDKNYHVSRATVYNTLELLLDSGLVRKNQFNDKHANYEKAYLHKQHDHLICMDCNQVIEFCDPRLQMIRSKMGDILNFEISHHSLTLHGHCKNGKSCKNLLKYKNAQKNLKTVNK